MNEDVINHMVKKCKREMDMYQDASMIHDGAEDDALATYQAIIKMLEEMK